MKRKSIVSMIVCIVFTLSLLSNLAYAVPAAAETETSVSVQQQEPLNETSETQRQEEQQESSETVQQNTEEEVTETTSEETPQSESISPNVSSNKIIITDITETENTANNSGSVEEISEENAPFDYDMKIAELEKLKANGLLDATQADSLINSWKYFKARAERAAQPKTYRSILRNALNTVSRGNYTINGFTASTHQYVSLIDSVYMFKDNPDAKLVIPGYITIDSVINADSSPGTLVHVFRDIYDELRGQSNMHGMDPAIHHTNCNGTECKGTSFQVTVEYLRNVTEDGTEQWATVNAPMTAVCAHSGRAIPPQGSRLKVDIVPVYTFMSAEQAQQIFPDGRYPYGYHYVGMNVICDISLTLGTSTQYQGISGEAGGVILAEEPPTGYAKLKKSSQNPALTNGNSAYSLAGAEYGVYSEAECINKIATLTTAANGESNAVELPAKVYFVKEEKAPYGFALDDTVHTVTVTPGQTATLNVTDIPQLDPVAVFLGKIDRETNLNRPSGSASLAGAEFTVKYYPALVNDVTGLTPQYTWVITTDTDGYAFIPDNQLPYVTYPDGSTRHGLPIGTLSIQETKAPAGYLINDTVFIRQITSNGSSSIVDTYNQPEIPEQVIRGGFTVYKSDKDRLNTAPAGDESTPQGNATFLNTTFTVTNISGGSVRVNGTDYANNAVCYTFKLDANGRFTSPNNLLPYGTYVIRETVAGAGYTVNTGWSATINITANGQIVNANTYTNNPLLEQIIRGGFKLQKSDSETNLTTPQGSAAFQGANFEIINMSAQAVYTQMDGVWGWRAPSTICYKISADENGAAQSPVDALPFGSYRAKEVAPAPTGYLVNTTWQRDFQITQNGVIHDLSNTPVPNQVIRGDISLVKFKEDDGEVKTPLAGVEFTLTHEKTGDKVVIVTDAQGYASTTNHALVYGKWLVEESKTPFGFNSIQPFTVDVSENHRIYYYIIENQTIRSAIRLVKVDAATGNTIPIANAEFQIRNVNTGNIVEFTTYYPNVQKLTVLKTGDDGTCVLPQMLEAGTYEAIELKAPVSYLLSNQPIQFEVTGGGDFTSPVEVKIPNTPVMGRIQINKTGDIYIGYAEEQHPILGTVYKPQFETGKLIGVVFDVIAVNDIVTGDGTIRAKQGDIVDTVTTTAGEDWTKYLFLGTYIVRERQPLGGYIAAATDYTVTLEYKDDVTPIVTAQADIHNEWLPSRVSLEKEAEQWKVVQNGDKVYTEITVSPGKGFLFALFAAEDIQDIKADMPVAYGETDDNGKLIFEGKYLHGQYYLKEIYTNTAYHPDDTKYPVDLTYTAGTTVIEVQHKATNRYKTIEVTIDKKEITGDNPVPEATIEIYDSNGQVVYRDVTDKDGQLKDIKLIPGKYTFKEILAPDFYALNVAVFEFEIKEDGSIIGDTLIRDDFTRIQFKKVGIGGIPLPGAKFGLYTVDAVEKVNLGVNNVQNIMSGNSENVITREQYAENILGELIAEAVSDENGIVTFEKIPHKEYIVKELEAPEGFQLSDETYSFKIDGTYVNPDAPVKEFVNIKTITIFKTSIDGTKFIPGSKIAVYKNPVSSSTNNLTDNLTEDTNTAQNADDRSIVNAPASSTDNNSNDNIGNNSDNNDVNNAEPERILVHEGITDENGEVTNIPISEPGEYVFFETAAPSSFSINDNVFTFTVDASGIVTGTTNFSDDITRIIILKIDTDTKEPLPGTKFGLFDENNNLIQEAVTNSDGLAEFSGMPYGKYFIRELEAAPGYKLLEKQITIYVDETWLNPEPIEFENSKLTIGRITGEYDTGEIYEGYNSPKTSDNTKIAIYFIALLISGISLLALYGFLKKEKNEKAGEDE